MGLYKDALVKYDKELWKADYKLYRMELVMRFLTLAGFMGVMVLLVRSLLIGSISAGAFAAVFTSIDSIFRFMENIVTKSVGNISQNMVTVVNYIEFCRYASGCSQFSEDDGRKDASSEYCILADRISFSYPNSKKPSIDQVSIAVKRGETIAVVGENGAGKSTFVKLMLGLYEPVSGTITRNYQPGAASAVFQNYQRYRLCLDENIYISDSERIDLERVRESAQQANVDYKNTGLYPKDLQTPLGKEFGGAELSGGQWQRIAIARALYKNHDLIALDEPTASIDPLEESRLYQMFAQVVKGKTAFIVTHRVGSARIADRIIVLDHGRVVEEGTHDELLKRNGKYAYLYQEQAKWYE